MLLFLLSTFLAVLGVFLIACIGLKIAGYFANRNEWWAFPVTILIVYFLFYFGISSIFLIAGYIFNG